MDRSDFLPATDLPATVPLDDDPLWYKDAIIYELHVKAFFDANDDGTGDFRGLTEKLDYIQSLGVNTVWLLPFYPSPMLDDGYDVADYHNVHPSFGTRQDFRHFVREAHRRGLRVITELVVNHTSDQHPWFQAARRAPADSVKRNYYVWSDDPNRYAGTRIIFTDTESSNWSWDPVAKAHYWHRFFSHQPDLNFDNPRVLQAILRTMRFWLDMGVDGFRLDAIPYLVEREGTNNENLPETHAIIRQIRAALDARYPGRLLLAEANQWPEDVREYFGSGDECHMAYHFPLMPRLFMAIAMEERYPVVEIMAQTPEIPDTCQWAIFLRNHDELTLEMVTDRERDYMYERYGRDQRTRINVGIRRRLAPLMDNDRPKIELISFLLMTLPGAPILYYGDEIGMGDNIYLGDRNGVRTPMQWSPDRNAGFSRADPQRLYLPPVMDAVYGYEAVNVEAQGRSSSSLLNWTRRLIAVRRKHHAFGRGRLAFLQPGNRAVLAYLREHNGETLLCVANLARNSQAVELDLARFAGLVPVDIVGGASFPPVGHLPYLLTLHGHGYFAFRLAADVPPPRWHEQRLPTRELPVLVLTEKWQSFFTEAEAARDIRNLFRNMSMERLRDELLVPELQARRWFGMKGRAIREIRMTKSTAWASGDGSWLLVILQVTPVEGIPQRYFFPLSIAWETRGVDPWESLGAWSLAKVRHRERVGALHDALGNPAFARAVVQAIAQSAATPLDGGTVRFMPIGTIDKLVAAANEPIRIPSMEQSHSSVFFGTLVYLKAYRQLQDGVNPEVEIGRFLTERSPFAHVARVLGVVEWVNRGGDSTALAVVSDYLDNQGDAWTVTLKELERVADADGEVSETATTAAIDRDYFFERLALLGNRLASLHRALNIATGDPNFDPEPVEPSDLAAWRSRIAGEFDRTMARLTDAQPTLPERVRPAAAALIAAAPALHARLAALTIDPRGLTKTRYHGDLHLGQILDVQNDFVFVDFEGEPARPLADRRAKHCVLRDLAGLARSISYAVEKVALQSLAARPDRDSALRERFDQWEARALDSLRASYRRSAVGVSSVPADDDPFAALLELFVIEKALYEVRYELDQRPDWVGIPIAGLMKRLNR